MSRDATNAGWKAADTAVGHIVDPFGVHDDAAELGAWGRNQWSAGSDQVGDVVGAAVDKAEEYGDAVVDGLVGGTSDAIRRTPLVVGGSVVALLLGLFAFRRVL